MAKTTSVIVSSARKSATQLRQEYNDLAAECAEFDPMTKKLMRQREEDQKKWVKERAEKRKALVASKGKVYLALVEAEAAEKAEADAKQVSVTV